MAAARGARRRHRQDGGAAAELVRAFAALDDALRAAVQSLWEKTDDAPAAELAKAGIENSCRTTAAPKLNTVRVGPPEARRTVLEVSVVAWLELLENLAAPVAAAAKAAAAGDWSRLKCLSPSLYALPAVLAKFAASRRSWDARTATSPCSATTGCAWCAAAAGKRRGRRDAREGGSQAWGRRRRRGAAARRAAARRFRSSAARGTPPTISSAGCAEANGRYALQGTYQQAPRWVHQAGQLWLIRYRLPSGTNWWYIADKDQLNVNDGDLYRVRAVPIDEFMPPSTGWSLAKDGRPPMPSFEFVYDRPAPPPSPEQPRRSFFGQLFGRRQSSANAEASSSSSSEPPPSAEVRQLIDMGFARDRVEGALRRADNDTALALNILLDPEAAAETAAAAEPRPAARVSSAAAVAKTAAVAADARGWARVADRSAPLAQLLAEEFGEEGGAALLDQAAAATAAAAAEAAARPTPPLTLTIDQGFSGSQQDHEKHPWASVDLPAGYASGTLKVSWKDQGYGNRKGRLWCRTKTVLRAASRGGVTEISEWYQLSTGVAEHSWTQAEFEVPAACFEAAASPSGIETGGTRITLELACGVAAAAALLHVRAGATLTLKPASSASSSAAAGPPRPAAPPRPACSPRRRRAQRGHPRERS